VTLHRLTAGVSPKVASTLMGHKTPEYQPGAASITLRHYTHTLPGELERARDQLDRFLVAHEVADAGEGVTGVRSLSRPFRVRAASIDVAARNPHLLENRSPCKRTAGSNPAPSALVRGACRFRAASFDT
jgi:hypothetical protein